MFKHLKSPAIAGKIFVLLFLFIAVMIVGMSLMGKSGIIAGLRNAKERIVVR